MEFFHLNK